MIDLKTLSNQELLTLLVDITILKWEGEDYICSFMPKETIERIQNVQEDDVTHEILDRMSKYENS